MMNELTDTEDQMKSEVVAAYGEVLRKLKINQLVDEPNHFHEAEEKQAERLSVQCSTSSTTLSSEYSAMNNADANLSNLKKYFINTLSNLEEALVVEQKKLSHLENEIIEKMHLWQKEEKDYLANRDLQREKEQLRYEASKREEEKDYLYQRDLQREKDHIQYEMAKRELENALREQEKRIQAREDEFRRIKEKENWILATEQEYHLLKQRVEQFPEELKQATQKAENNTAENLTLKYEYEMKLFHMEMETERKLYQQTIANLEAKIAHLESLKYSFNKLAFNSVETAF